MTRKNGLLLLLYLQFTLFFTQVSLYQVTLAVIRHVVLTSANRFITNKLGKQRAVNFVPFKQRLKRLTVNKKQKYIYNQELAFMRSG